jgi:hypothetical protein
VPERIDLRKDKIDLLIVRGDERRIFTATITDGGVPVNVSADTFSGQIRLTEDATDVLATITVTFVTTGADGEIKGHITAAESELLPPAGVWDVEWHVAGGDILTIFGGAVCVQKDVTRV